VLPHLLERHDLSGVMLDAVNAHLEARASLAAMTDNSQITADKCIHWTRTHLRFLLTVAVQPALQLD
jgi:hypothetical protein